MSVEKNDFRKELKALLNSIMFLEYQKAEAREEKPFLDSYYEKEKYAPYYEYYIIEKDIQEYDYGLLYRQIISENIEEFSLMDYFDLPDIAKTYALLLLRDNDIEFKSNENIFEKIDELLKAGKIDRFTSKRLHLASEYLYKHHEYVENDKNSHIKKHTL